MATLHKTNKGKTFVSKDTGKYGKGMYAAREIKKGEIIHRFGGKRVPLRVIVDRLVSGKENLDDPLQIGRRTYMDLDAVSRTFNHSCDPNAGMRKVGELFALRIIAPGEQITYDYSATIAPTEWEMKCKCGSKNCRKTLGDIRSIPKAQLNHYKKEGALPRYMKSLVKELANKTYRIPAYELTALKRLKAAGVQ